MEYIINLDQLQKLKDLAIHKGQLMARFRRFKYPSNGWHEHNNLHSKVSDDLMTVIEEITGNKIPYEVMTVIDLLKKPNNDNT